MINDDFVRTGNKTQPLKHAIVVVDGPGRIAIDKDGCFTRGHLQAQRDGWGHAGRETKRWIRIRVPRAEARIIGMIEAAVKAGAPQQRRVWNNADITASPVMRLCFGGSSESASISAAKPRVMRCL